MASQKMTHITKVHSADGKRQRKRTFTYEKMVDIQIQLGTTKQEAQNLIRKRLELIAIRSQLKFGIC